MAGDYPAAAARKCRASLSNARAVAMLKPPMGIQIQAHLNREAARLEGRSPRAFLSESEQRCGCGHDHSASYAPLLRHRS